MKTLFILFCMFVVTNVEAQQHTQHISEQLLNGTIRIEAYNKNGKSTGTGFFMIFYSDKARK